MSHTKQYAETSTIVPAKLSAGMKAFIIVMAVLAAPWNAFLGWAAASQFWG